MRRLISMMVFHIKMYFQSPLGILAFVAPVILSVVALWCVQQQGSITSMGNVGIYIADKSIVTEELVAELEAMKVVVEKDEKENLLTAVEKGQIDLAIISETDNILKGLANNEAVVTLVFDESNPTATQIKQLIESKLSRLSYLAYASEGNEGAFIRLISLQKENRLTAKLAEQSNMELTVAFGMFVFMFLMNVGFSLSPMMREKEQGIVERVRLSSIKPSVYLGGHILGSLILLMMQFSLQGLGFILLDQQQEIHYLQLLGIGLVLCVVGISIVCMMMTFVKNSTQLTMVINIGVIPLCVVSNCLVPIELLPHWVQRISILSPLTWVMKSYKDMIGNTGLQQIGTNLSVALLMSIVIILLTMIREKKKKNYA